MKSISRILLIVVCSVYFIAKHYGVDVSQLFFIITCAGLIMINYNSKEVSFDKYTNYVFNVYFIIALGIYTIDIMFGESLKTKIPILIASIGNPISIIWTALYYYLKKP